MNTLSWLAGLLEAEGSFNWISPNKKRIPRITLEMADRDVVEAAAFWMDCQAIYVLKPRKITWSTMYGIDSRKQKTLELLELIYSVMGARRQKRIVELLGFVPHTVFELDKTQWLIGILEGEGSFLPGPPSCPNQPRVQMTTTDYDIAFRVAELMGVSCQGPYQPKNPNAKGAYLVTLRGSRAVDLMREVFPYMSERRQKQIQRATENYARAPYLEREHHRGSLSEDQVREIKQIVTTQAVNATQLGKLYGVSQGAILDIKHGRSWKHVK